MKTRTIALMVLALFVVAIAAAGCGTTAEKKADTAKKTVSAVCPVMGTHIPDVTKAAGKSVYKGKTYYFCCDACKPAFDKDPEKYIKKNK